MKRLTIEVEYDPPYPCDGVREENLSIEARKSAAWLNEVLSSSEYYGDKVPHRVTVRMNGTVLGERTFDLSDLQPRD